MGLEAYGEGPLRGIHFLSFELASWANQDDAGHAFALDALHVPTFAHGLFRPRQPVITEPATPLARGADRMQRLVHVERDPLGCFNCAQNHLRPGM